MTRSEILAAAEKCVTGKREQDYGSPEDNFETIGRFWTTYLKARYGTELAISADDVSMMQALLKIARIAAGSGSDSFVDLAGYAACAGEIATGGSQSANENLCVGCGNVIPEGWQCCPHCNMREYGD